MLNSTPMAKIFDIIYPVGSIYMSTTLTTKAQVEAIFGGTWEKLEGRFLLGSSSSYTNGATGGSKDAVVVGHEHVVVQYQDNRQWIVYASRPGDARYGINNASYSAQRITGNDNDILRAYYTGEPGTDKNMPPYLVVNMFKRTALGVKHFLASIFALFSKKFIGGKAIC